MSDTPRTDSAYFAKGATLYDLAGEMKKIERELAAANERIKSLEDVLRRMLATDGGDGLWSASRFYDARQDAVALMKKEKP